VASAIGLVTGYLVASFLIAGWRNDINFLGSLPQTLIRALPGVVGWCFAVLIVRRWRRRSPQSAGACPPVLSSRQKTQIFAVAFVVFGVTFLNLQKNVTTWVERGVPALMKAPLFEWIEFRAFTWFAIVYGLMALVGIGLMSRHARRPIALVPATWLGRGQLLYVVFLWMMVVGNFERALMGFSEGRLITEWVIFIHAIIVTAMVLVCPGDRELVAERPPKRFTPLVLGTLCIGVVVTAIAIATEVGVTRWFYGDTPERQGHVHTRFGDDAAWRTHPMLKGERHR